MGLSQYLSVFPCYYSFFFKESLNESIKKVEDNSCIEAFAY